MIEEFLKFTFEIFFQYIVSEMSYSIGRGRARGQPQNVSLPGSTSAPVPGHVAGRVGKPINATKPSQNLVPDSLVRNLEVKQNTSYSTNVGAGPPKVYPGGYDDDDDDEEDDWNDDPDFAPTTHPGPVPTRSAQSSVPSSTGRTAAGFRPAGFEEDKDDFDEVPSGGSSGAATSGITSKPTMCPAGYEEDDDDDDLDYSPGLSNTENMSKISSDSTDKRLNDLVRDNPDMDPEFLKNLSSHSPVLSTVKLDSDPVSAKWLEKLESEWQNKTRTYLLDVGRILRDCYHAVENPYLTALHLMSKSKDFYLGKSNGLYLAAMREFENWLRNNEYRVEHLLNNDLKAFAFQITVKKHTMCLDIVIRAFRLDEADPTFYLPYVKYILAKNMIKEGAVCITKLKLQEQFTMDDVILPLILQDKINLVEGYVYRNAKQQEDLVKLLDQLCDDNADVSIIIKKHKLVGDIKRDNLRPKAISKLAIRLMKLYDIPMDLCPNINKHRRGKALRFLLYRKFNEKSLNQDNWDELVLGAVDGDKDMQMALIDGLLDYYEMEEAARWAVHFNLPQEQLPHQVVNFLESSDHDGKFQPIVGSEEWDEEDWGDGGATSSDDSIYHQLALPREEIHLVTNKEEFYQSLGYLNKEGNIIGLDAEWKPGIGVSTFERVALLQAADAGRAYLYDIINLSSELGDADWQQWGHQLLETDSILKLGFGFESDFKVLSRSLPGISEPLKNTRRFVDLLELKNAILRVCPDAYDKKQSFEESFRNTTGNKKEEAGLSSLVRQCLGRPLDKSQQMSNWEFRPLRQAQVTYAALDAYVLLDIYKVLKDKIKQKNLQVPLEPCSLRPPSKLSKQQKKQRRVAERPDNSATVFDAVQSIQDIKVTPLGPPITPKELAVVTDTMLQGLGRHLRCCGVDVVILENNQDHDDCGKIARKDNRIILTSGQPYLYLKSQVPEGRCISVAPGKARDQVLHILKLFNVTVTKNDIFSRCQVCNGDIYLHISPTDMKNAWIKKQKILSQMQSDPSIRPPWKLLPTRRETTHDPENKLLKPVVKNPYVKDLKDANYCAIDMSNLTVGNSVPLQVETIPKPLLDKVELFYCCATCGKVFWEGKHFDQVCEQFSHVLNQ